MSDKFKYFIIAVVAIGSIGIWLPVWIDSEMDKEVNLHSFPLNVTTTFVTVLFGGSMDYFLSKFRDEADRTSLRSNFLNAIFVILGIGILVWLSAKCYMNDHDAIALLLSIVGLILSWIMWWKANKDNPNFNSIATLGGEIK